MAWNGSDRNGKTVVVMPPIRVRSTGLKIVLAAIGVILLGALVGLICWFAGTSEKEEHDLLSEPKSATLSEFPASIPHKDTGTTNALVSRTPKADEPVDLGWYTNKAGVVKRRTGKGVVLRDLPKREIFSNPSDMIISSIVSLEPGDEHYITLPKNFSKQFANSLLEKIEIQPDDTPEDIEKKQQVIQVRKELCERIKNGENVVDILNHELEYLNQKSRTYKTCIEQLRELRRSGASNDEIAEFAVAAKRLLNNEDIQRKLPLVPTERKFMKRLEKELEK